MGGNDHAVVALVENRFVFKKETLREQSTEEFVDIVKFEKDDPVCKIRRGYGLTLNLTNYESARLDVSIEVPCLMPDVDAADEWARQWVEKRVIQEVENVRGSGSADEKPKY